MEVQEKTDGQDTRGDTKWVVETTFEIRKKFKSGVSKDVLKREYSTFSEKYEKLFGMICSYECRDQILNMMMLNFKKVKEGHKSQHDASVDVGGVLVDNYVKPAVDS